MIKEIEPAAKAFKMQLQYLDVLDSKDIETAFRAANKGRAQAVLTLGSAILVSQRAQIAALAVKNRLPAIYHSSEFVEAGGLMFYGVNVLDLDRRAATLCRQDSERRKARRSARGAADEVRVHRQSQSRQADRPDDSAERVG